MNTSTRNVNKLWLLWRYASVFVHIVGVTAYAGSLIWQKVHQVEQIHDVNLRNATAGRLFAGRWKYLTHWDHVTQCLTFSLCLIADIALLIRHKKYIITSSIETGDSSAASDPKTTALGRLLHVRDYACHSLAFPIGLFVSLLFWTLYGINPELVLPKTGTRSPAWLNHIQHTLVGFLVIIEHLTTYHKRHSWRKGVIALVIFVLAYNVWIFYIGLFQDYWVYPILAELNWGFRLLFVFSCIAFIVGLYFVGNLLHHHAWDPARRSFFEHGPPHPTNLVRLDHKISF